MDLDVNIIISKWLGLELILVEFSPSLRTGHLEASECFWIWHFELSSTMKCVNGEVKGGGISSEDKKECSERNEVAFE